jgi:pimeloyl-ACP methyl ester carboxylesterase
MREEVLTFGENSPLIGIMTMPAAGKRVKNNTAVLLWNAGFLHRVGPHRLYVDMARKLAEIDFLTVRFDLSGKGDSPSRKDTGLEKERTIRDVKEVMDYVSANTQIEKFVLIGLCSGADDAFPIAVQDERVSGLVMLDGFGFRTLRYYVPHYLVGLFIWSRWKNFVVKKYRDFLYKKKVVRINVDEYVRAFPSKIKAIADLQSLIERRVSLLFVYTAGVRDYYNYKGQFKDMLNISGMNENLQVEYFKEMTHTFTRMADRNKLISCICNWMHKHYY